MSASVDRFDISLEGERRVWPAALLALVTIAIAFLVTVRGAPLMPFGLVGGLALVATLVLYPTVGCLLFFAIAWVNAPVVVTRTVTSGTGNAWLLGAGASGLLLIPAFVQSFVLQKGFVLDRVFLWMLLFLGAILLSTLIMARDYDIAFAWIGTYLAEGLLLYLLVVNAIRDEKHLRLVLWTLLLSCAVLSAMPVYQEVTKKYDQSFFGFGVRMSEESLEEHPDRNVEENALRGGTGKTTLSKEDRAQGPVDDPNHFAQILLVVLPMGLMLAASSRNWTGRLTAILLTTVVLAGVLLTYSRGGFIALAVMVLMLVALGDIPKRWFILGAVLLTGGVIAIAPGYLERMQTIGSVSKMDQVGDQAVRGRATEMLAAMHVMMDYPVIGVGPGQYTPFYSVQYMDDPGIAYRGIEKERRAHTLYFELGAETGVLGLAVFLAIAVLVLRRLLRVRKLYHDRPHVSRLATGLGLGIIAYLGTSVFLSFAFMRYWWLLLALAGVLVRIAPLTRDYGRQDRQDRVRAYLREAAG